MNQEEYEATKKIFEFVQEELKRDDLTEKERNELQERSARMAGILMSPWLPVDAGRQVVMFVIFLLGLYLISTISVWFFILWILLIPFSPRIVAEIVSFFGRISR